MDNVLNEYEALADDIRDNVEGSTTELHLELLAAVDRLIRHYEAEIKQLSEEVQVAEWSLEGARKSLETARKDVREFSVGGGQDLSELKVRCTGLGENERLRELEKDLPGRWELGQKLTDTEAMLRLFISMHANHAPCKVLCPIDSLQVDTITAYLRSKVEGV